MTIYYYILYYSYWLSGWQFCNRWAERERSAGHPAASQQGRPTRRLPPRPLGHQGPHSPDLDEVRGPLHLQQGPPGELAQKLDTFIPSFDLLPCLLSPAKTTNFKPVVLVTFLTLFSFYLFTSINTVIYNQLRWCSTCYYVETLHWQQYNYTTCKYYIDNYVKIMWKEWLTARCLNYFVSDKFCKLNNSRQSYVN